MMKTLNNTPLIDPSFGRKIIDKHQKGNRIFFRFPVIVLKKNTGKVISQTFYPGIRLHWSLHFHNQKHTLVSLITTNNVFNIKPLPRWFKSEQLIREHTVMSKFQQRIGSKNNIPAKHGPGFLSQSTLKIPVNLFPMFSFLQAKPARLRNASPAFIPVNHPFDSAFYKENRQGQLNHFQDINHNSPGFMLVNHQWNPVINRENSRGRLNHFQNINNVSPAFAPVNHPLNPVSNRETGRDSLNYFQGVKAPQIANMNRIPENFYLQEQHNLQREFTEIKKMVLETQKTIIDQLDTQTTRSPEIKPHIDFQRISDRVYQEIERRIRTERERRGL